jgi:hypothetical protein
MHYNRGDVRMRIKNNKMMLMMAMIMILAPVIFAALSMQADALGVSPARTEVDFEPERTREFTISIINNERRDMKLLVSAEGDLADLVKMDKKLITIGKDEPSKSFTFALKNPNKFDKAGVNEIPIKILEIPQGSDEEEDAAIVGSALEIVHQVIINVPYPGIYAEVAEVYMTTSPDGKYVQFSMPVFNKGKEMLKGVKGIIEVQDLEGNLIGSVETNSIDIESNGEAKITAQFLTQERRGRYHAKIRVIYAGKQIDIEKDFFIGAEMIEVRGVSVEKFTLGSIAKFNILLNSRWNELIKEVYAEVEIKDSQNRQLTKFKTSSVDMDPNSIKIVNAYWDTENVNPGVYKMHVVLHYAMLTTYKVFSLDVGFNDISIRDGITGAVVPGGDSIDKGKNPLLTLGIIAIIIMNIAILLLNYKMVKGKKGDKGNGDAGSNNIEKKDSSGSVL